MERQDLPFHPLCAAEQQQGTNVRLSPEPQAGPWVSQFDTAKKGDVCGEYIGQDQQIEA
jgi:hypothetical protein